jgi:hypothetical protein
VSEENLDLSGFGNVNLDGNFEGYKFFQLHEPEQGKDEYELILRLLPAMHSYRETGEWNFYYGQHYGHVGENKRNPDKPRARPFGCIHKRDNKTKKVLTQCPKCAQYDGYDTKAKARAQELLTALQKKDPSINDKSDEFKKAKKDDTKYQALSKWLRSNNCDRKIWINAMDQGGNFGVLKLSYTTFKDLLKPLLKKLRDQDKVDAFNPAEGRWLRFTRTGSNPNVTDGVEVFSIEQEFDGPGGKKIKAKVEQAAPMTNDQIRKALKVCPDLAKSVVKFISAETMQKLIDSSGAPEETDAIWPPETKEEGEGEVTTETAEKTKTEPEKPAAKQAVKPEPTPEPEQDEEEAEMLRQQEELQKRLAAKAAAKTKKVESKPAEPEPALGGDTDVADDPDKFLNQFQP